MTYKKIDFWGIILESFQKSCSLKPCQNICFLNICRYKKNNALAWVVQKANFWGVHLGGPGGCWYFHTMSNYLLLKYLPILTKNYHPSLSN